MQKKNWFINLSTNVLMKNIDEVKTAKITLAEHENECENESKSSCIMYLVVLSMIFTINIGVATYFVYCKYMNHDKKKQLLKEILSFRQQFTKHINDNSQKN